MPQPSKEGKFLCWECAKKEEIARLHFLPIGWSKFTDVDWSLISKNYTRLAEDLLRQFRNAQGADPAYGLVFQLSQNWILDLHINTQGGVAEIPERMREIANYGKELSDEEWLGKVGRWYPPAWKYAHLNSAFESDLRGTNDFHYDLFESLYDTSADSDLGDTLERKVDEARLSAVDAIRSSEVFTCILKTPDFAAHIVDDDGLDYHTKARVGT